MMKVGEVAEMLRVSKKLIYKLISNGELGCFRVGKRIVLDREEHVMPYLYGSQPNVKTESAKMQKRKARTKRRLK